MDHNDKVDMISSVLCTLLGVFDVAIGIACIRQGVTGIADVQARQKMLS